MWVCSGCEGPVNGKKRHAQFSSEARKADENRIIFLVLFLRILIQMFCLMGTSNITVNGDNI